MLECRIMLMAAGISAAACVPPAPTHSISEARRAYAQAVDAEAERYCPDSLALASRALEDALAEVEVQQRRQPPFVRDYTRARSLLGQAHQLSRGARYEAWARRDQLRAEIAVVLERASHDLAELERSAPSEVDGAKWTAWLRLFRAASDALADARRAFREGDYYLAREHSARVGEHLRDIEGVSPKS
jgi:hypothetical protein